MLVSNSYFSPFFTQKSQNKKYSYTNLTPLNKDTVSFGSMKKHEFNGNDLLVINKFKPPIETFKSNEDFQNWCLDKMNTEYIDKDYIGRHRETLLYRLHILNDWFDFCSNSKNGYSGAESLFILNGITSHLKDSNDTLPPIINEDVLNSTMAEIKENVQNTPNYQVDFNKLYQSKLTQYYLSDITDTNTNKEYTGWIIIPSEKHDSENFERNVDKLRVLSCNGWCTKSFYAEPYLLDGDFHIYIENNKPKVGIRYEDDEIREIQGDKNDNEVPREYLDKIKEHTKNEKMNEFFSWKLEHMK